MEMSKEEFDRLAAETRKNFGDDPNSDLEGYCEFLLIQTINNAIECLGPNWVKTVIERELSNVQ